MNKKQKAIFLIGAVIVIIMGLFPPWHYQVVSFNEHHAAFFARGTNDYGFIFDPPITEIDELRDDNLKDYISVYPVPFIDIARLFVQWVIVITAFSALIFIMKDTKNPPN